MAPLKLAHKRATPLSSLHRSLAVMLLAFEVCEVCCVCHSHANPGDNPSHLFSETSVHWPRLYSGTVQLPRSTLILKGLEDGKEAIYRGSLDMLVQTLCSLMNTRFRVGAGKNWLLGENVSSVQVSIAVGYYCCLLWETTENFHKSERSIASFFHFIMPLCGIILSSSHYIILLFWYDIVRSSLRFYALWSTLYMWIDIIHFKSQNHIL